VCSRAARHNSISRSSDAAQLCVRHRQGPARLIHQGTRADTDAPAPFRSALLRSREPSPFLRQDLIGLVSTNETFWRRRVVNSSSSPVCSAPINITTAAGLASLSASTTLPVTLCWMRCALNSLTGMSSLDTPWAPPRGPNWALYRWPLSAPIKSARDDQIAVCRGHSVNAERSSTRRARGSRLAPSTIPSSGRPHSPALSRSPTTSIRATQ